jgi:hypothetical protein
MSPGYVSLKSTLHCFKYRFSEEVGSTSNEEVDETTFLKRKERTSEHSVLPLYHFFHLLKEFSNHHLIH